MLNLVNARPCICPCLYNVGPSFLTCLKYKTLVRTFWFLLGDLSWRKRKPRNEGVIQSSQGSQQHFHGRAGRILVATLLRTWVWDVLGRGAIAGSRGMWRRKRCKSLSRRPLVPVQSFAGRGEVTGGKVGHRPIRFPRTRLFITGGKGNRHWTSEAVRQTDCPNKWHRHRHEKARLRSLRWKGV